MGCGRRWLVIDTDAGVDDAVALCLALRCAARCGFVLKLITTTYLLFPTCCKFKLCWPKFATLVPLLFFLPEQSNSWQCSRTLRWPALISGMLRDPELFWQWC